MYHVTRSRMKGPPSRGDDKVMIRAKWRAVSKDSKKKWPLAQDAQKGRSVPLQVQGYAKVLAPSPPRRHPQPRNGTANAPDALWESHGITGEHDGCTVNPLFKNLLQQELQGLDCKIQPFLSDNWNKNPRVPWNSSRCFLFLYLTGINIPNIDYCQFPRE